MGHTILLLLIFAAVALTVRGVLLPDPAVLRILHLYVHRGRDIAQEDETGPRPVQEPISRRLGRTIEGLLHGAWLDGIDLKLRAANLNLRAGEFLLLCLVLGVVGLVIGMIIGSIWSLVFAGLFGAAPFIFLKTRGQERSRQIGQNLPDALNSIANALRSGFSLLQSLEATAKQTPGALGQEFERTLSEARVGVPIDEALQNMSRRAHSPDLELVVTAIQIQRQVGGNLAEVLDRIQSTIRDRVRLQGEVRALTAQGRLSSFIVGLMPVGLLGIMLALSPTFVTPLFTTPTGHLLLILATILEVMGFVFLRRIVRIEV